MMDRVKVGEFGILFIVETRMKRFWFFLLLRNIELRGYSARVSAISVMWSFKWFGGQV